MKRYAVLALGIAALIVLVGEYKRSAANDSAASTATGGLQLTREQRVSMQKERLFISTEKVRVEYEFLNETDTDIRTEVAFPIPEYNFQYDDPGGPRSLDDFKVWANGNEVKYETQIKALANGRDVTSLLTRYGIDLNSFGHFDWKKDESLDFAKLPTENQTELVRAGAFDPNSSNFPAWTVSKTYYWEQVFPAHAVLRVTHEYKPIKGFRAIEVKELDTDYRSREIAKAKEQLAESNDKRDRWSVDDTVAIDKMISNACVDAATKAAINSAVNARQAIPLGKDETDKLVGVQWVDYILTTATNWKKPVKDFDLVVEKPRAVFLRGKAFVSFCWDGPVIRIDDQHFSAHATSFVPKRELHVAFFD